MSKHQEMLMVLNVPALRWSNEQRAKSGDVGVPRNRAAGLAQENVCIN